MATTAEIRAEQPEDVVAIRHLLQQAFPSHAEAELVDRLRQSGKSLISFVAIAANQVVGHILFSLVEITPPSGSVKGVGLAPLAVAPHCQRQGIGSQLIQAGLQRCQQAGWDFVVVLGEPAFYQRFGFSLACDRNLQNQYNADEAFHVLELTPGCLQGVGGTVCYAAEFAAVADEG